MKLEILSSFNCFFLSSSLQHPNAIGNTIGDDEDLQGSGETEGSGDDTWDPIIPTVGEANHRKLVEPDETPVVGNEPQQPDDRHSKSRMISSENLCDLFNSVRNRVWKMLKCFCFFCTDTYRVTMTINEPFKQSYRDRRSEDFKELSDQLSDAIDDLYQAQQPYHRSNTRVLNFL